MAQSLITLGHARTRRFLYRMTCLPSESFLVLLGWASCIVCYTSWTTADKLITAVEYRTKLSNVIKYHSLKKILMFNHLDVSMNITTIELLKWKKTHVPNEYRTNEYRTHPQDSGHWST